MRWPHLLLVAAVAASIGGCRSPTQSTQSTSALDGTWSARPDSLTALTLSLTLSDTLVAGTGLLASGGQHHAEAALTVTGLFLAPNVSLSIEDLGRTIHMTFVGALGGVGLVGTLNGAGYTDATVTFAKH